MTGGDRRQRQSEIVGAILQMNLCALPGACLKSFLDRLDRLDCADDLDALRGTVDIGQQE